jgi:hypothetical protein
VKVQVSSPFYRLPQQTLSGQHSHDYLGLGSVYLVAKASSTSDEAGARSDHAETKTHPHPARPSSSSRSLEALEQMVSDWELWVEAWWSGETLFFHPNHGVLVESEGDLSQKIDG